MYVCVLAKAPPAMALLTNVNVTGAADAPPAQSRARTAASAGRVNLDIVDMDWISPLPFLRETACRRSRAYRYASRSLAIWRAIRMPERRFEANV